MNYINLNLLNSIQRIIVLIAIMLLSIIIVSCSSTLSGEEGEGAHDEGGEESGTQYALTDTANEVYNGVRLIMYYDAQSSTFIGTVENTTSSILSQVRVEVHLSNGIELGPTTPADLNEGEIRDVTLTTTSTNFDKWSAHPEVGNSGS